MLFDTHAHLNDEDFAAGLGETVARAMRAGVKWITNIGYDLPSSRRAVEIAGQFAGCFAAVGVHPHEAATVNEDTYQVLQSLAQQPKVVAWGEIGLDYYRDLSPREKQRQVFREQLNLAGELKLPVVIHDRDAHNDILQIMREEQAGAIGGILHCFSGSWEMARACLKMGFYISLAGPVTFKNARRLQDLAKLVPLEYLLIETDCPYLTPEPYRGKRNEPAYVLEVAKKIAELRKIPLEEVAAQTTCNAKRVFRINE